MSKSGTNNWQTTCQEYLQRLGNAEYQNGIKKCKTKHYQHNPSEYHRTLVELLGKNDEHGFKTLKMLEGYTSILGF